MYGYLSQLHADAHAADLIAQAERARLVHLVRTDHPGPSPFRRSVARLLVALATRLDHPLQTAAPAPTTGPGC